MEKVKVTKEVAEAIEKLRDHEVSDFGIVANMVKDMEPPKQLNKYIESLRRYLHGNEGGKSDDLLDALRIGYEIEPEFKTKDFVVYHNAKHERRIGEIIDIQYEHNRVQFYLTSNWRSIDDIIRHATESEIKQEKERRWWAKHNRIINEYKTADLVIHENRTGIWEVTGGAGDNATITNDFADSEQQVISKHLKLICPAENRLDLSN